MLNQLKEIPAWLTESAGRNTGTLWQVVKAYRANLRQGTVGVKTRAMVKSTGKKPYKQKKTGSARRGSFVANLHVGGGVAHGPKMREYRQSIPQKMNSLALSMILSERATKGKIFVGDVSIASGKTKDAYKAIESALPEFGSTVICLSQPTETTLRALRNIRGVQLISPEKLTAFNVINAGSLITSTEALEFLKTRVTRKGSGKGAASAALKADSENAATSKIAKTRGEKHEIVKPKQTEKTVSAKGVGQIKGPAEKLTAPKGKVPPELKEKKAAPAARAKKESDK